jgi:hypothetical protein
MRYYTVRCGAFGSIPECHVESALSSRWCCELSNVPFWVTAILLMVALVSRSMDGRLPLYPLPKIEMNTLPRRALLEPYATSSHSVATAVSDHTVLTGSTWHVVSGGTQFLDAASRHQPRRLLQ